ncbi:hypothetical protein V6N13_109412 [Hibiscus sabdariffa]
MQNQDQVLSFSLKPKLPATIVGGVPRRGAIPEIGEAAATLGSLPQVNKPDSELFVTKSEAPRFKNRTPKSSWRGASLNHSCKDSCWLLLQGLQARDWEICSKHAWGVVGLQV